METAECLTATVDKFVFQVVTDRRYSPEDCWVQIEGKLAKIGITDFRQQTAGDVAFVECKPVGIILAAGEELASIETIKVNLAIPSPLTGTVVAVNEALNTRPELVNTDPYGQGWRAALCPAAPEELENLLTPAAYLALITEKAESAA